MPSVATYNYFTLRIRINGLTNHQYRWWSEQWLNLWQMAWRISARRNNVYFGEGLLSTLSGIFLKLNVERLTHYHYHRPAAPKTEEDAKPSLFYQSHERHEYVQITPCTDDISHATSVPLFYEVTHRVYSAWILCSLTNFNTQLRTVLAKKLKDGPQEIDILHWMTRTALELIGQSGMGYSFDSLEDENDYHPYSQSVKRFVYAPDVW